MNVVFSLWNRKVCTLIRRCAALEWAYIFGSSIPQFLYRMNRLLARTTSDSKKNSILSRGNEEFLQLSLIRNVHSLSLRISQHIFVLRHFASFSFTRNDSVLLFTTSKFLTTYYIVMTSLAESTWSLPIGRSSVNNSFSFSWKYFPHSLRFVYLFICFSLKNASCFIWTGRQRGITRHTIKKNTIHIRRCENKVTRNLLFAFVPLCDILSNC